MRISDPAPPPSRLAPLMASDDSMEAEYSPETDQQPRVSTLFPSNDNIFRKQSNATGQRAQWARHI